ncbi:MAG: peroxidase family protein, partial [Bacteroidota bacterium]
DRIPAGYTYLGQFIVHDLNFDVHTHTDVEDYPGVNLNMRTPPLDLDSVYGQGPIGTPIYFDQRPEKNFGRTHFLIDELGVVNSEKTIKEIDLPRISHAEGIDVPIIPDIRNDEHIILSQLHAAVLSFHNNAVDKRIKKDGKEQINDNRTTSHGISHQRFFRLFKSQNTSQRKESTEGKKENTSNKATPVIHNSDINYYDTVFRDVRKEVKRHFQWVVVYDYLPKIVGRELVEEIIKPYQENKKDTCMNLKYYTRKQRPYIPHEFSVAAFRFGHSMVRRQYLFKEGSSPKNLFAVKKPFQKLKKPLLDWNLFFKPQKEAVSNKSLLINPAIAGNMLNDIPDKSANKSITFRNILRGFQYRLPSGQSIAREMGTPIVNYLVAKKEIPNELDEYKKHFISAMKEVVSESDAEALFIDFFNNSPLWYYILLEASIYGKAKNKKARGTRLGPLGGRIVAEVLLGILDTDPDLFLKESNWQPKYFMDIANKKRSKDLKARAKNKKVLEKGDDSMIEFLKFAGVYDE